MKVVLSFGIISTTIRKIPQYDIKEIYLGQIKIRKIIIELETVSLISQNSYA
jgi:hypothetical protein